MGSRILFLAELVALHSIFIAQYSVAMFDHSSHGSFIEPQFVPSVFCWIISCQVGWQCNIYTKDGMSFNWDGARFFHLKLAAGTSNSQDGQSSPTDFLPHLHAVFDPDFSSNEALAICLKRFGKDVPCCHFSIDFTSQFLPEVSRYDVHVTSGGLALTHSMDFISNLAFKAQASHCWHCVRCGHFGQIWCWRFVKAYLAVPFVEEMRVLTDWTITRSYQLGFFTHEEKHRKKTVLWISNQNLFEIKSIQQKTSLAYIVTNFEKCFLFLKFDSWTSSPWRIQDIHGFFHVDEAGGRYPSFFSAMWIHFI